MFAIRSNSVRKKFLESTAVKSLLYSFGSAGLDLHPPCHAATPVGESAAQGPLKRRGRKSGMQARMELDNFERRSPGSHAG